MLLQELNMENAKKKMELYRVILGQLLIEARKEKGFSQQAVADLAGISRVSVSYYERGERSINMDDLISLCDSCGFDYVQIIKKLQKSVSKMED